MTHFRWVNLPDSALSPLDLSSSHASQFPSHSPDVRRSSIANNETEDVKSAVKVRNRSTLLNDVGSQLVRLESRSALITRLGSNESLLKTSEHQQILYLYSTYMCSIMSIKSVVAENPWRNIDLSIAGEYPYSFNSIASMVLIHLTKKARLVFRSKGYWSFHARNWGNVRGSSTRRCYTGHVFKLTKLTVSEFWHTHTSSGVAHLKGAKSMIQKVSSIITPYSDSS